MQEQNEDFCGLVFWFSLRQENCLYCCRMGKIEKKNMRKGKKGKGNKKKRKYPRFMQ